MQELINSFADFVQGMGLFAMTWKMYVMWGVVAVMLFFGVVKQFEPLLLVPIAFGALIANIPDNGMVITQAQREVLSVKNGQPHTERINDVGFISAEVVPYAESAPNMQVAEGLSDEQKREYLAKMDQPAVATPVEGKKGQLTITGQKAQKVLVSRLEGGLFDFLGQGIKCEIFPALIFMGVGALTDFGPLLASPKALLLGAAAQGGVAFTFIAAMALGFTRGEASAIGIIGGADGPTSIFLASNLAPHLLGAIAVAAYTYMALVPLIQPPFMKLFTTEAQRKIKMKSLRQVSKGEKLFFCFVVTIITILICPDAAPLLGMLMFGNFLRECKVTERLVNCAQNELMNITTILLGVSVGLTMQGGRFLQVDTLLIIGLGVVAFAVATVCGLICAQLMNLVPGWRKNPINPLIGSAGVSAVPMAARVSHNVGQQADRTNFLLMHAMGPNVAGVIGTAVIAGYYITTLRG
ncbi:MAG: sodium ion-translocating decarboxylase subunit beta [Akkermansiaceae bacterium]|nr:sodium ion-translocating decarboxylase subunit beta [Akkermansiaceae bacterium]